LREATCSFAHASITAGGKSAQGIWMLGIGEILPARARSAAASGGPARARGTAASGGPARVGVACASAEPVTGAFTTGVPGGKSRK